MGRIRDLLRGNATLLLLVPIRVLAGLVGVVPSVVALTLLDPAAYGTAAAVVAVALVALGPVAQYLAQSYLRDLMRLQASGGGVAAPAGTPAILAYVGTAVVGLEAASAAGFLATGEARWIEGILVVVVLVKILEIHFIGRRRKYATVLIFYVVPPIAQSAVMVFAHLTVGGDGYRATLLGFLLGQLVAIAAAVASEPAVLGIFRDLVRGGLRHGVRAGLVSPLLLFTNGGLLSLGDQLPTILLRGFGASAAIPAFEVVRKICSVPAILVHAFGIHFNPDLIAHVQARRLPAFHAVLARYLAISAVFGIGYVACVVAAFSHAGFAAFLKGAELAIYWPLLASAVVTTLFAPIGAALIAFDGDRWWFYGAVSGVAALLLVALAGASGTPLFAVTGAVLVQNLCLSLVVATGVVLLRRRALATAATGPDPAP